MLALLRRKQQECEHVESAMATPSTVHGGNNGPGYTDVFNQCEVEDAHCGRDRLWHHCCWEDDSAELFGMTSQGAQRIRSSCSPLNTLVSFTPEFPLFLWPTCFSYRQRCLEKAPASSQLDQEFYPSRYIPIQEPVVIAISATRGHLGVQP